MMNKTVMATAIVNALKVLNPEITGAAETALQAKWETVCDKVIDHVTTNAEIIPGSFLVAAGIPVATAGSPTAQTGATTAPQPLSGEGNIK